MASSSRAQKLLALVDLVNSSAKTILQEWEKEDSQSSTEDSILPSLELYNAQRTVVATCGAFSELLQNPENFICEVAMCFFQSRALHIAAEHRVADVLAAVGQEGMLVEDLGAKIGLDPRKLERIMRSLCSVHIFAEVGDSRFANNSISSHLAGNETLRAYIVLAAETGIPAVKELPDVLRDPVKGASMAPVDSAFTQSVGRPVTFFEWLEEKIPQDEDEGSPKFNPMLEVASLAMVSGGRVCSAATAHDYPWGALGSGTIVDVGGGLGSMSLELARTFSDLKFVIQDCPPVLEQGVAMWQEEFPEALASRVTLMPHDFFQANPTKDAAVYLLRHIMHDWSDEDCVRVLLGVKTSMSPTSRLLIVDQVTNTTFGCPEFTSAPAPLPPNYGVWNRLGNAVDLDMMVLVNGVERTPAQFRSLAASAGLETVRIWECRGSDQIVELQLPEGN